MHRIAYLQSTLGAPEIVTLELSDQEHDDLHKDPLVWINNSKIFSKDVSSAKILSHVGPEKKGKATWYVLIPHHPACAAAVICIPI